MKAKDDVSVESECIAYEIIAGICCWGGWFSVTNMPLVHQGIQALPGGEEGVSKREENCGECS
jgi:hypothetical protein